MHGRLITGLILSAGLAISFIGARLLPNPDAAILLAFACGAGSCFLVVVREIATLRSRIRR